MAFSVQMPALGESVTEGTVTRWLKQEGDTVEVDEPLLEVSTDKVDTEIPSPAAGVLQKIVAGEDETVQVGGELAVITDSTDSEKDGRQESSAPAAQEQSQQERSNAQASAPEATPAPAQSSDGSADDAATRTPVTMPALGESVTEGTITRWLKQVGDSVQADEPLVEVSTDKVDTEIPAPATGTLLEMTANEDDTVEVGGQIAVIGSGDAALTTQPAAQAEARKQTTAAAKAPQPSMASPRKAASASPAKPQQASAGDATPYVTPLVRKLANENGVDLDTVKGTGVGGRIRKQDVLAAVEAEKKQRPSAPATSTSAAPATPSRPAVSPELAALRGTVTKASRIRQTIAKRTRESLQTSAQLTQVHEVDVTRIAKLRQLAKAEFEAREGVKLTFLPFFVRATVEALKQHPNVNAYFDEEAGEITYYDEEHVAVAVDTDKGLISPVIHRAGELNLAGLARKIADLAERTRTNRVTPDELSGGTFTVTNLGSNGALFDTPIINQPQSGILGVGAVVKRPVVITNAEGDDTIAVRSMAYLALTYDHRQIDGADAGRFLTTVKHRLQDGAFEADLGL